MQVTKRNRKMEDVSFDKITKRLTNLSSGLKVDTHNLSQKVINYLNDGIETSQIDNLAAETAATMGTIHPDYITLASRIEISSLHKETSPSLLVTYKKLWNNSDKNGNKSPRLSKETYNLIRKNHKELTKWIDYDNDYNFDYFGIKTLMRAYLLGTSDGKIVERPQQMFLRVSIGIWGENFEEAKKTYDLLSSKHIIHATPTLFNSGTPKSQLSSCFLLGTTDSIEGIYKSLSDSALISQNAGGLGLHIHKVRSKGSYIRGTGGISNGLVPMLRNFNETMRYVDQGGQKRKGSMAIYLEPWHADIYDWLELKKNHGKEEMRARDLFYGLWNNDLFMERVKDDGIWSLMCPDISQGLDEVYGDQFKTLYEWYEDNGHYTKQVKARDLWNKITTSQIETGTPYMLYKDHANKKSNQKNLGTIKSSNLCTEIIEYSNPNGIKETVQFDENNQLIFGKDGMPLITKEKVASYINPRIKAQGEHAVCNLASLCLPAFMEDGKFDYDKLFEATKQLARNLDKIIDKNFYPTPETKNSNLKHRPIGIGGTGIADVFHLMGINFDSEKAEEVTERIWATIYYAAIEESTRLAEIYGSYSTFENSPTSEGILQFDLWDHEPIDIGRDWGELRNKVKRGLRNSLSLMIAPNASSAIIAGTNESIEPYSSNLYTRRTLSGEFIVVNKHLINELLKRGLWDDYMRQNLMANNGSVQNIDGVPQDIKYRFRTAYELKQKTIVKLAAIRAKYICQSQSLNIFMDNPSAAKLSSLHFYTWELGLKTGMYYLRSSSAVDAIKFTLDKDTISKPMEVKACSIDNPDCESCSV